MPDPLKESLRIAAKVLQENEQVCEELATTRSRDWPAATIIAANQTRRLTHEVFAALVKLYLRTL